MTFVKGSDVSTLMMDTLQKNVGQELESMGFDLRGLESSASKEAKIKRIAAQFEEMLINTLLKSAFTENQEDKEDMALSFGSINNFRTTLLSQFISDNGGLGYQQIIEEQIKDLYTQQESGSKGEARTSDLSSIPVVSSPVPNTTSNNETGDNAGSTSSTGTLQASQTTQTQGPTNPMASLDIVQPVESEISSEFGWRVDPIDGKKRFHYGVDFAVSTHTPVKSVMDGTVTFSGWKKGYGNIVEITHADGYVSKYGHNSRLMVKEGDQVKAGTVIARSGSTGRSTGPHLHFEIAKEDNPINPTAFLKQEKINVLAQKTDISNVGL